MKRSRREILRAGGLGGLASLFAGGAAAAVSKPSAPVGSDALEMAKKTIAAVDVDKLIAARAAGTKPPFPSSMHSQTSGLKSSEVVWEEGQALFTDVELEELDELEAFWGRIERIGAPERAPELACPVPLYSTASAVPLRMPLKLLEVPQPKLHRLPWMMFESAVSPAYIGQYLTRWLEKLTFRMNLIPVGVQVQDMLDTAESRPFRMCTPRILLDLADRPQDRPRMAAWVLMAGLIQLWRCWKDQIVGLGGAHRAVSRRSGQSYCKVCMPQVAYQRDGFLVEYFAWINGQTTHIDEGYESVDQWRSRLEALPDCGLDDAALHGLAVLIRDKGLAGARKHCCSQWSLALQPSPTEAVGAAALAGVSG